MKLPHRGRALLTWCFDFCSIAVWDLQKGARARVLQRRGSTDAAQAHQGGVNAVYLSPDASHALTVSKVRATHDATYKCT